MPTQKAVLDQFRKRLGIEENPRNSNRTEIGKEFGWNGVAWCAETVYVCLHDAGFAPPKTASAQGMRDGLVKMGWKGVSKSNAAPGDVIFYDWTGDGHIDHTGIVEGRNADGRVIAIEGNTAMPDGNGGVRRVVRSLVCVAAVVRPPYPAVSKIPSVSIKFGSSNKTLVTLMQRKLIAHGFGSGITATGRFGPGTLMALRAFQRHIGLAPSGVCGPKTWTGLLK